MPAINPRQLEVQIIRLAELIMSPSDFIQLFRMMLDNVGHESLKSSVSLTPRLVPSFKPPKMYVLQIFRGLRNAITNCPEESLLLTSELWNDDFYESKQLATFIAGTLSAQSPEQILEITESWLIENRDIELSKLITDNSYDSLVKQYPQSFIDRVNSWIHGKNIRLKRAGIRAMVSIVESGKDEFIPDVLVNSLYLFHSKPKNIKNDVYSLISKLSSVSPQETGVFLIWNLDKRTPIWVRSGIRKSLKYFPQTMAKRLETKLRNLDIPEG